MTPLKYAVLAGFLLMPLASATVAEPALELVQQNCVSCHQSEVYTRDDRLMQTYDDLLAQVRRCELNLGLSWFDEQIEQVARHLNQEYYKF